MGLIFFQGVEKFSGGVEKLLWGLRNFRGGGGGLRNFFWGGFEKFFGGGGWLRNF